MPQPRTVSVGDVADDDSELTTSVGKALTLLLAVGSECSSVGVTALAATTNIPKSTAFRLLGLLQERGLVERVGSKYRLGVRLFELGNAIAHCQPRSLRDLALPHLVDLHVRTGLTVHLAIRDGSDILYLEKVCDHDRVPTVTHVGGRLSAHCTALGKALLAHTRDPIVDRMASGWLKPRTPYTIVDPRLFTDQLQSVRSSGFALDHEESSIGLMCVAAPVLGTEGEAVAAVSLTGRTPRMQPERHAQTVRSVAMGIGREVRGILADRPRSE
jgi:DNA-binding IclR family transcriptional regulator